MLFKQRTQVIDTVHAAGTVADIDMTGQNISAIICWRLYRRGNTDANASAARLLSIDAHYRKDADGSEEKYTK